VSKSETRVSVEVSRELGAGTHDLVLSGPFGSLTVQGAYVVGAGLAQFDAKGAWTQRQPDGSVKVYAKNPVGVGKVQFFFNDREIAWVRAADETDPKLRFRGEGYYLVRTVNLQPGKNVFEIYVEGERVRRAAYWVPTR